MFQILKSKLFLKNRKNQQIEIPKIQYTSTRSEFTYSYRSLSISKFRIPANKHSFITFFDPTHHHQIIIYITYPNIIHTYMIYLNRVNKA